MATLNTRISLKWDSYENWSAANPVLLAGEVGIAVVPAEAGAVTQEPAILLKVGNGTSSFADLPFVSGIAADVYDWAKASEKPAYTADEITGLSDYISGEIQDTDTQYKLEQDAGDPHILKLSSKGLSDQTWNVVATITTADTVYDDTALAGRVTALEGLVGSTNVATQIANAISALNLANTYDAKGAAAAVQTNLDALEDKIGTVAEGKTVVEMISDAQNAATYDDTALAGRVTAAEGEIDTLVGSDAGKSARTIANEELAAQLIPESAKESLNTLSEIATWIQAHPDDASAMNAAITALQNQLSGIDAGTGTVKKYVDDAITALSIGDYAKAADLTALAARVTELEGDSHTHDNKDLLDTYTQTEVNLSDAVAKKHEHTNKAVLDGITEEKVTAWDDKAEANHTHDIASLTQANGYIVFNCGSATVNI